MNVNTVSPRVRTLWALSLLCGALTTGLTFAHVLELFQKMSFGPVLWTTVEHSLYRYFALVGGSLEVATVVMVACLAVVLRRIRQTHWHATVGAWCFTGALASWFAVVRPANAHIASWSLTAIPDDWMRWRAQWEYGHAIGFAVMLAGYLALVAGALHGLPPPNGSHRELPTSSDSGLTSEAR